MSVETAPKARTAKKADAARNERAGRTNDPEGTKRDIIAVATEEFSQRGLSGARIDEIAAKTRCSKRMIYYYFESKEGLYLRVLEAAYSEMRRFEANLQLDDLAPMEALARLVRATFDHHNSHEDFIRLVMIENIHHAEYLAQSSAIQQLNLAAIDTIGRLLERGAGAGAFRGDIDPVELHWKISALCFFNVSNRSTFSRIFKRDLAAPRSLDSLREGVVDMILHHVEER